MMRRRYEAYKDVVVRPFFRDHFARLDRQIVLVDALAALNAGPDAVHDLEAALAGILVASASAAARCLSALFRPRIDRILFAATKADHLHHASHDRLEAILRRMVERAAARAEFAGAAVDVVALAAVRATREARSQRAARRCRRSSARRCAGETRRRRNLRRQNRNRHLSRRPAGRSRRRCSSGDGAFRGLSSAIAEEDATTASCASGRRSSSARRRRSRRCLISASTARSNS